jgi:hypothetical protein
MEKKKNFGEMFEKLAVLVGRFPEQGELLLANLEVHPAGGGGPLLQIGAGTRIAGQLLADAMGLRGPVTRSGPGGEEVSWAGTWGEGGAWVNVFHNTAFPVVQPRPPGGLRQGCAAMAALCRSLPSSHSLRDVWVTPRDLKIHLAYEYGVPA